RCWTPCGGCQTGCDCLLELGWLKCVSGSRALQVTSSGKAGLSEIFHIEISDEGVLSRRLYAPAPRDLFLSTTREGRRPPSVSAQAGAEGAIGDGQASGMNLRTQYGRDFTLIHAESWFPSKATSAQDKWLRSTSVRRASRQKGLPPSQQAATG